MTRTKKNNAIGAKYHKWVNQHTRLLNFINNDVGYVSDVAAIAGLFLGVSDVVAVVKIADEVEEGVMAAREVEETEMTVRGVEKGAQAGGKSIELKNIGISRKDLSTYSFLTSDITGVGSGAAQSIQSSTSGIRQGAIFGVTAGILNSAFSGFDVGSIYFKGAAEKAEKEVEGLGTKSFLHEEDRLAEVEAAKLKSAKLTQTAEKIAKASDSMNLALGSVASIGAGIYYAATGSTGSGVATTAYGSLYAVGSFKNEISVGIKEQWKSVFKDAVREV